MLGYRDLGVTAAGPRSTGSWERPREDCGALKEKIQCRYSIHHHQLNLAFWNHSQPCQCFNARRTCANFSALLSLWLSLYLNVGLSCYRFCLPIVLMLGGWYFSTEQPKIRRGRLCHYKCALTNFESPKCAVCVASGGEGASCKHHYPIRDCALAWGAAFLPVQHSSHSIVVFHWSLTSLQPGCQRGLGFLLRFPFAILEQKSCSV